MPRKACTRPSRSRKTTSRRAHRAGEPALFQKILVDYYGTPTPLGQLAGAAQHRGAHAPRHAVRQGRAQGDREGHRGSAEPRRERGNDGNVVRVTLPELTEDRRKEFVKIVRSKGEDAKVAIRNIRRKAKDDLDALKSGCRRRRGGSRREGARGAHQGARRRDRRGAAQEGSRAPRGLDGARSGGPPVATKEASLVSEAC